MDWRRLGCVLSKANINLFWAANYRYMVFGGSVEVRLVEVLMMIVENHGYQLLAARVHPGGHMHIFVSAKLNVCIPIIVGILKSNSDRLLFLSLL